MVEETPMAYIPKTGHDPHDLRIIRASREALHHSYELLTATRPAVERFLGARPQNERRDKQRSRSRSRSTGRLPIRDDGSDHGSPGS
jgi:hypothetical protein